MREDANVFSCLGRIRRQQGKDRMNEMRGGQDDL
jgi:hypothetical protein